MQKLYSVYEIDAKGRRLLLTTPDLEQAILLAIALEPPDEKARASRFEVVDDDGTVAYPKSQASG